MSTPAQVLPSLDWDGLDAGKHRDEAAAVRDLLARVPFTPEQRAQVVAEAAALVRAARAGAGRQGVVESFLQEFSLGTREGLALMCLAEALLRTPDEETRDRLIAEKIGAAHRLQRVRVGPLVALGVSSGSRALAQHVE